MTISYNRGIFRLVRRHHNQGRQGEEDVNSWEFFLQFQADRVFNSEYYEKRGSDERKI